MKCSSGFFDVTVTLKQTSANDFSGSGIGQTTGANTTITGHISDGNRFTWDRRGLVAVRGGGTFNGNRMRGNERGLVWTCKFTGRRR